MESEGICGNLVRGPALAMSGACCNTGGRGNGPLIWSPTRRRGGPNPWNAAGPPKWAKALPFALAILAHRLFEESEETCQRMVN